ncbi:MAG: ribbon-helix-helix protein, CopG family [Pseudonocardia sp.]
MRRTTVYLDPELEVRLKAEARRLGQPVAQLIREALRARLDDAPRSRSPHAGRFSSGRQDTASRVDEALRETGFGAA